MRKLTGVVVSNKMRKTAVVQVDRLARHPKYQKYYRAGRKFKAETAGGEYRVGDTVAMQETRPRSREKRWEIMELIKRVEPEAPESETETLTSP